MSAAIDVEVGETMIRLGQFLKFAGIADSGAAVKPMLAAEEVTVNGELELRRGRQLVKGDEVVVGGQRFRVT